jgi:hypothetical protein
MDMLNFVFKLLKHGGIFLLRVVGILAPVAGSAIAASVNRSGRNADPEYSEHDCAMGAANGHFPDGSSCYSDARSLKYLDD